MEKEIYSAVAYVNKESKNDTITMDEVREIFKLTVFEYSKIDITKFYYEKHPRSLCNSKSIMNQLLEDAKNSEFDLIVFSSVKAIIWDAPSIFQRFREITHQTNPVYIYFEYENLFVSDDESLNRLELEITLNSFEQEKNRRYKERLARRRKGFKTVVKVVNDDLCNV